MKDIITYINEWGGEKIRKPSMKEQLSMLRDALNKNKDMELAFEYDYFITDIIYASGDKELEIDVHSDPHAGKHVNIKTVQDLLDDEDGAIMKCKKIISCVPYAVKASAVEKNLEEVNKKL
jgi:hypothetical protein